MRPYILIYATDVPLSTAWYEALGFQPRRTHRNGGWAELEYGGLLLFLHASPQALPAGFALPGFEATEALEGVVARLASLSTSTVPEIVDEGFGRTLTIHDPDGYEWQIVQHEPELYV